MDLRKIIELENIKAELIAVKNEALIREQAVRAEEMAKIRAAFMKHLELFPEFNVITTEHEIRATYMNATVLLMDDPTATVPEMPLSVGVKLIMPENREYKITTVYDPHQQEKTPQGLSYRLTEDEKKIILMKRFISGEFTFTFQYRTNFRIKPYETIEEVLNLIN